MTKTVTFSEAVIEQGRATPWNKTGNRRWEAEWMTDVVSGTGMDAGHRIVTLTASHHDGVYTVRAGIATRVAHENFKVTRHEIFKDPMITFSRERARFSQKRLQEMFDAALAEFNAETFYVVHEVASA